MNRLTVTNHVFTLGRLILLRLLYLSYITFYELPESYQSSYEAIEHGIKPLPTWPDYLGLSKWLTEYPYTDLTRVESLGLAIAIAVVFLGLIHGSCRRLIELIDVPIRWERSPLLAVLRTIARSTLFLPSEIQTVLPNHLIQVLFSLILLLNFLIVSHITLNTIPMPLVYEAFNRPGGSLLNTLFIIFKSIFWGDWDVRTTFIRLYFVFFVVYLGLSFLYAMLLTLWEDIFWPGLCIFSTHAALKLLFPYFDGLVGFLGLPYSLRDVQIPYPHAADAAEYIFGSRSTIRYHLIGLSDIGLKGRDELVLALCFSIPALFFLLGRAHFVV